MKSLVNRERPIRVGPHTPTLTCQKTSTKSKKGRMRLRQWPTRIGEVFEISVKDKTT